MLLLQVNSTSEIYGKFLTEIQDISFDFVKIEKEELIQKTQNQIIKFEEESKIIQKQDKHNILIKRYDNLNVLYFGTIINNGELIVKFGISDLLLSNRIKSHIREFGNFYLYNVFECFPNQNKKIENIIKHHCELKYNKNIKILC